MFSNAIVRTPGPSFALGLTTANLGAPDHQLALRQHELYCAALEQCGLTVTRLESDEQYPDATFVEDTAVLVQPGLAHSSRRPCAILTRPGAASRAGEVECIAEVLARFFPEIYSIEEPGTLDGGDVCEADKHFFIGISERTNASGAQQLAKLLAAFGCTSSFVDIRNVKGILHLKSGIAYLGDQRLAVIDALAKREEFRGYERVHLQAGEEYAANCVRINDRVLIAAGYPLFGQALRALGYETIALEMSEFQKMDGGLSCLSLRF